MVRDINGLGSPLKSGTSTGNKVSEKSGDKVSEQSSASSQPATSGSGSGDEVSLSSQALTLQSLEEKALNAPDVNMARVEAIKTALANNQFNIDDLVIADKLLASDSLL